MENSGNRMLFEDLLSIKIGVYYRPRETSSETQLTSFLAMSFFLFHMTRLTTMSTQLLLILLTSFTTEQFNQKQEHRMQYQCSSCERPSFYLKIKVKKVHNSKTMTFRVMPLALQLHLVMMSKYSKVSEHPWSLTILFAVCWPNSQLDIPTDYNGQFQNWKLEMSI